MWDLLSHTYTADIWSVAIPRPLRTRCALVYDLFGPFVNLSLFVPLCFRRFTSDALAIWILSFGALGTSHPSLGVVCLFRQFFHWASIYRPTSVNRAICTTHHHAIHCSVTRFTLDTVHRPLPTGARSCSSVKLSPSRFCTSVPGCTQMCGRHAQEHRFCVQFYFR